jgi:hypothetical protein
MKIASYRVGGERRVGLVDERGQSVSPFDEGLRTSNIRQSSMFRRN